MAAVKLRIVKKTELTGSKLALLSFLSLIGAIIAGGILFVALGHNPFEAYMNIVLGAFRSKLAFQGTVKIAVPLLITALGLTLAFKMKFWNIGGEGQIIMGAVFATYFALFHNNLPHIVLMLVMLLAGIIGGGLWAIIPAYFKTRFNTNETLLTLMMNYIALYVIRYLTEGPWLDPTASGFPKIASFVPNAQLDKLFGIHIGWIIALILVALVYIYLRYSKHGYEISVVGESENTARYAGMNVRKIVMRTMFFSGAICGIVGVIQATGVSYTLNEGVTSGVGFTAIIVAWLARLNPIVSMIVAVLLAVLEKGCSVMQSAMNISPAISSILQGIILFFVLAFDFFANYKIVLDKGGSK